MAIQSAYKSLPAVARATVAVAVGAVLGVTVYRINLAYAPFQPPVGVTYWDGSLAYLEWVRTLSTNNWYTILAGLLAGSFFGGALTQILTAKVNFPPPVITGFCVLFYGIVQFLAFYNPEWMTFAACSGCLAFAWLGGRCSKFLPI
ncbi:MAG: hypothetical protein KGS48_03955 [Bacteroidetes bacterium]|nr:hypothetical protein [Bacteroidota bacterium]